MQMVTIPKKEYERLKKLDKQSEAEAIAHVKRSLADLKAGKFVQYDA